MAAAITVQLCLYTYVVPERSTQQVGERRQLSDAAKPKLVSIHLCIHSGGCSWSIPGQLPHPTVSSKAGAAAGSSAAGTAARRWRILQRNNIHGSAKPCSRHHLESLCMPCSLAAEGLASWQGAKELKMDTSMRNVHAHFHAVSRYF